MNKDVCELCAADGGEILYRDATLRIVAVTGADGETYRGFCRVIWNAHVKEMTDLTPAQRSTFMKTVFKLEAVLREQLNPEKMNIASLGNMTPHLHWHVIPRFIGDATYPKPIWATPDSMHQSVHADARTSVHATPHIGTLAAAPGSTWRNIVRHAFNSVPNDTQ